MTTDKGMTEGNSRTGERIEGVYSGPGFCYVDAGGRRYGRASWIPGLMDGTGPSGTVRPILRKFANAISLAKKGVTQ